MVKARPVRVFQDSFSGVNGKGSHFPWIKLEKDVGVELLAAISSAGWRKPV